MSDQKLTAAEIIKAGTPVYNDGEVLVIHDPKEWQYTAIGMAMRDIAKDEVITYNPRQGTGDIFPFTVR